jgi:hypothetical protein
LDNLIEKKPYFKRTVQALDNKINADSLISMIIDLNQIPMSDTLRQLSVLFEKNELSNASKVLLSLMNFCQDAVANKIIFIEILEVLSKNINTKDGERELS